MESSSGEIRRVPASMSTRLLRRPSSPRSEIRITSDATVITCETPRRRKSEAVAAGDVTINYLMFKWFLAMVFIFVLVMSLLQLGRDESVAVKIKLWPIYLSHWALVLNVLQAGYGAVLYTVASSRFSRIAESSCFSDALRIFRVLHNTSTVLSVFIAFAYWLFIYSDELVLDVLCLFTHSFNSILMLIDFLVSGLSYHLFDLLYPLLLALVYSVFSVAYYALGGLDTHGNRYIYKPLDWSKPKSSLALLSIFLVTMIFIHVTLWLISIAKMYLRKLCGSRPPKHIPLQDLV